MKGADISSLQAMEDSGAVYYDFDGIKKDAIEILKAHGFNWVRLRIWNQPTTSFDRGDYCDLKHTVEMAKRVRRYGLKLLLDFHYSDTWADWKCQKVPMQWRQIPGNRLSEAVYRYTSQVLQALGEAQAAPDMVQIGNEIGRGILWDYGSYDHPDQLAELLNGGIHAVRDMSSGGRRPQVMLHVECGGNAQQTEKFFTTMTACGAADFDVIGLSYYPYWAGPYANLLQNMKRIQEKLQKPVVIVETAFPYTDNSTDDMPNVVTGELTKKTTGLEPSEENQRKVMDEILRLVRNEPNGAGVFYWEPVWYCIKGVGAYKGVGNEWENQALFDQRGRALSGLRAFETIGREAKTDTDKQRKKD